MSGTSPSSRGSCQSWPPCAVFSVRETASANRGFRVSGQWSDVPWAMVFPGGGPEPRHPSQLYEAGLEGLGLFIFLSLLIHNEKIRSKPGIVAGSFMIGYALCRMFVEHFREPDWYLGYLAGGFTMGQLLSLPMILIGLGLMMWAYRRAGKEQPTVIDRMK